MVGHDSGDRIADFDIGKATENGPLFNPLPICLEHVETASALHWFVVLLSRKDLAEGQLVRCFVEVQPAAVSYNLLYPPNALQNPSAALFRNWLISRVNAIA